MVKDLLSVLLICHKRPHLLLSQLKIIDNLEEKVDVYIHLDNPNDKKILEEFNQIFKDNDLIEKYVITSRNQSLNFAVPNAITWFFDFVDEGIILEDDVIPTHFFFQYCHHFLQEYRDEKNIVSINSYPQKRSLGKFGEAYLSKYFAVWGWATWKDRWYEFIDESLEKKWKKNQKEVLNDLYGRYAFIKKSYWRYLINKTFANTLSGWCYKFFAFMWLNNYLTINSEIPLIRNLGTKDLSTNTSRVSDAVMKRNEEVSNYDLDNKSSYQEALENYHVSQYEHSTHVEESQYFEINLIGMVKRIMFRIKNPSLMFNKSNPRPNQERVHEL